MALNLRQKKVAKILSEDVRISVRQAKLKAGYSPSEADKPQRTTRSKGFHEEMMKQIPDAFLVKQSKLQAKAVKKETVIFGSDISDKEIKKYIKEAGGKVCMIKNKMKSIGKGKNKIIIIDKKTVYCLLPNFEYRDRALDKQHKLRGLYAAEKIKINPFDFEELSDEELEITITRIEEAKRRYAEFKPKDKNKRLTD